MLSVLPAPWGAAIGYSRVQFGRMLSGFKAMADGLAHRMRSRFWRIRMAYRMLLLVDEKTPNPAAEIMLADLAKFCRATSSTAVVSPVTGQIDPLASARADGRREVWLRIQRHLGLSDAEVFSLQARERTSYDD